MQHVRCAHCGRLPTIVGIEGLTEMFFWCSTHHRDPATGEMLGCGNTALSAKTLEEARLNWADKNRKNPVHGIY